MSAQSDDQKGGDELLDKLNQLLNRHRQGDDRRSVHAPEPPAAAQEQIPVLTDAVSGPALSRNTTAPPQHPEAVIESRLSTAIGREVNRLQVEMPQYSRQLATLSTTLAAAIRLLTKRYLAENEDSRATDPEQPS